MHDGLRLSEPLASSRRYGADAALARPRRRIRSRRSLRHPLTLRILSAVVVLRRLGVCRARADQPGLPDLHRDDGGALGDDRRRLARQGLRHHAAAAGARPRSSRSLLGVALGVAMGLSRVVEWLGSPIFIIAQAAPLAALIPLLDLRLRHRPHRQGAHRLHHGDAGDRAELARRGAPHAGLAAGDGPLVPRLARGR